MIIIVIATFYFIQEKDTMFTNLSDQFTEVDWNEVQQRNIVKNSIPITVLQKNENDCLVNADNFDTIVNHDYFVRSSELSDSLNFVPADRTLLLDCSQLPEEKSRLHVWYVLENSEKHATKYQYWITDWNTTEISN